MHKHIRILLLTALVAVAFPGSSATLGYWRFEGAAYTGDLSNNGLTLTPYGLVGPSQIANPGFGLRVPKTGAENMNAAYLELYWASFFSVPDKDLFTPGSVFTVEAYVRLESSQAGANVTRNIVGHWNDGNNNRSWRLVVTGETSTLGPRNLVFQGSSAGSAAVNFDSNFQLTLSHLYYVAAAVSQSGINYSVKFYLKDLTLDTAIQSTTVSAALSGFFGAATALRIGASGIAPESAATGTGYWDGAVDEVRLSDQALQLSELLISPNTNQPPVIDVQPLNQTVAEAENAGFSVVSYGAPPLDYQWFVGSTPIIGESNTFLVLNHVTLGQSGNQYSVVVTNAYGSITSTPAILTVVSAVPVIDTQPQNYAVAEHGNALFTVSARGGAPLRFQWRANNIPIGGETNQTLLLSNVTLGQCGNQYGVLITNAFGSITSALATLTVVATNATGASIQPHPRPLGDFPSSDYALTVNGIPVETVQWFTNTVSDSGSYGERLAYAHFSFSAPDTITIQVAASQAITNYSISPHRDQIGAGVSSNRLTFSISERKYLVVNVNALQTLFIYADPLEVDAPLPSGSNVVNIVSYGVDATGTVTETVKINQAIREAATAGKKYVYFPAGKYKAGTIYLQSGVILYLASGALLKAADTAADFERNNPGGTYERRSFISGYYAENSGIRGRGVIDGNGAYLRPGPYAGFWPGKTIVGRPGTVDCERVNNVMFSHCNDVMIEGVISRNSSSWNTIPHYCDDATVQNYKVLSSTQFWNDDGIDPDSCVRLMIRDSFFFAVDDAIVFKTCGVFNGQEISPDGTSRNTRFALVRNNMCRGVSGMKYGDNESEASTNQWVFFEDNVVFKAREGVQLRSGGPANFWDSTFVGNWYENIWLRNYWLDDADVRRLRLLDEQHDYFAPNNSTVRGNDHLFQNLRIGGTLRSTSVDAHCDVYGTGVVFSTNATGFMTLQNGAPHLQDDSIYVYNGDSVLIPVLANDSDPETNSLSFLNLAAPTQGTNWIEGNSVRYVSPTNYVGRQRFSYVVTDGWRMRWAFVTVKVQARTSPRIVNSELDAGRTHFTMQGTNGAPNGSYLVLSTTNLMLPQSDWAPLLTNTFDSNGNFSFTNGVNPGVKSQFFRIVLP